MKKNLNKILFFLWGLMVLTSQETNAGERGVPISGYDPTKPVKKRFKDEVKFAFGKGVSRAKEGAQNLVKKIKDGTQKTFKSAGTGSKERAPSPVNNKLPAFTPTPKNTVRPDVNDLDNPPSTGDIRQTPKKRKAPLPPPSSAGQGHGMTGAPPPPPPPPSGLPAVSGQKPTGAPAKPEGQKSQSSPKDRSALLNEIRQGVKLKKVDTHAQNASSANKPPVPSRPSTVVAPPPPSGQGHGATGATPPPPPPPPGLPAVPHAQNSSDKSQPGAPNQSALLVDIQKGVKLKKVPENEKNVYSNSPKKSSLESAIDKRRQDQGYAESESESESDWD
jgi:hypothetical protein